MKNILTIIVFLLSYSLAIGQITISTNTTWSTNQTLTSNVTVTNGATLTINPGVTISLNSDVDLIIETDGILDADGTSDNEIIFTASGTSWGHIVLNNTHATDSSILDYCVIEKGGPSGSSSHGGGLQINADNVRVSNSTIQDNSAVWGGGIFVERYRDPIIKNCIIDNNEATNGGGGIYFWNYSAAIVRNCIISNNSVSGTNYGGGGVMIGPSTYGVEFYNSTFVENSSNGSGDAVYIYSSNADALTNCIIWGTSNPVSGGNSNSLNYCMIEGSQASSFSNCDNLNSSNTASDGPNFTDPSTNDWSIKFISPCRDAGTDSGTPTTDYAGDGRIGTTDIGAYEVQYSLWTGTSGTGWTTSGNWEDGITPSIGSGDVVIPGSLSNYPDESGTITIASDNQMVIEPGAQATFGTLSNSGTFKMLSDNTGIASLKLGSYTDNGTEEIELFLEGGPYTVSGSDYQWHYVSSPVTEMPKTVFTTTTTNLLHYIESDATDVPYDGWSWHDGLPGSTVTGTTSFGPNLTVGTGYNVYHSSDYTYTFTGTLNTLNTEITSLPTSGSLSFSDHGADISGYNLLGNPFTCYLDWQTISEDDSFPAETSKGIIYTINDGFAYYNNGTSTNEGSRYIAPMQGFFNKTYSTGHSIPIPSTALVHDTQSRYKSAGIIPLIRMELSNESSGDELVIRFDNQALAGFDYDFDALKLFRSSTSLLLWTKTEEKEYAINGTPFPEENTEYNIEINVPAAGSFTLKATEIKGLDNYPEIYLVDTYQSNFAVNLNKTTDYQFSSEPGTFTDRFKISFMATGLDDIIQNDNRFNIYTYGDQMNIRVISDDWSNVSAEIMIYDLTGRVIGMHSNIELYNRETVSVPFNEGNGIYLVEIRDGNRRVIQKVSHR